MLYYIIYISAFYGSDFKDTTAAFSNYKVWESTGFILAFASSSLLCTRIKIYSLFTILVMGICGYVLSEYLMRNDVQKSPAEIITKDNMALDERDLQ